MIKNVKGLLLSGCIDVEFLEDWMQDNLCFTSLETLVVRNMINLKGWWRQEIFEDSQRPCLAKVTHVEIINCPVLKGKMPLFMGIEHLHLHGVDVRWVPEFMTGNPNCSPPSSVSPFDINNKIKEVWLFDIKGLICLPEGWIRHLSSLETLSIYHSGDLRWVSRRGLANLSALKCLELGNCNCEIRDEDENKVEVEVGMPWKVLQRLETLEIPVGDMHLREGLGYLTSLRSLTIGNWEEEECVGLASKALQNLHTLSIGFNGDKTYDLRKIGVHNLPFLTRLSLKGCKELCLSWKTLLASMKLDYLEFHNVRSVIDVDDMVVEQRSQIRTLHIYSSEEGSKWVHDIPWKWLASLESLNIHGSVGGLEEQLLPDGIRHLSSLKSLLIIRVCKKVRSVPKWFPHLKSLLSLTIRLCSEELKRRCEKEKGEDWPLICHITGSIYVRTMDDILDRRPQASLHAGPLNEEEPRKIGWCGLRT